MIKLKYKLVFIDKDKDLRYVAFTKMYKRLDNEVLEVKGKKFMLQIQNPAYLDQIKGFLTQTNVFIYFIDFRSGEQLTFEESKSVLNPDQLKTILSTRIIKDLVSGITRGNEKIDWYSIIIGGLVGLFIGVIATFFFMQGKIDELVQTIANSESIYPF